MGDALQSAFRRSETRVSARILRTETTLLKEFRKCAVPVQARQRVFEA